MSGSTDLTYLVVALILCGSIVSVEPKFLQNVHNNVNDSHDRRIIFPDSRELKRPPFSDTQGNSCYELHHQSSASTFYGYPFPIPQAHYHIEPRHPQTPAQYYEYPSPEYYAYAASSQHTHYDHGLQPHAPSPPAPDYDYWARFEHGSHAPPSKQYHDFSAVFHDIERKWEPENYDSSAEEDDMLDDFNGRSLVAPGQYPHMAALGFRSSSRSKRRIVFKCGGSLISDMFVLTAAHCCNDNGQAPVLVKLGDINLNKRESDIFPQRRFIARFYIHPAYKSSLYYNDIALLQLRNPVEYTHFVRPIRLWAKEKIPYHKVFTMGYGSTSFAQTPTNILTELDLSIVPITKCNQTLPPHESAPYGIIDSQICARDFERNRDTCQGDSGGPLQLNLERRRRHRRYRYYLVGIISYGEFCRSQYPGVYTRVSSYIEWIAPIVWPQYFANN